MIVGSLTRDRVSTGTTHRWQIGGVVWFAGTTMARMGIRTRVVTRTAAKDQELAEALRLAGVEVWLTPSPETTVFFNRYETPDADDRVQQVTGLAEPIGPADLREALEDAELAYLGPLHPSDLSDGAIAAVLARRPPWIALDVQGYTRKIEDGRVVGEVDPRLLSVMESCDVVKASEPEARLITGASEASRAALDLAASRPGIEAVVTSGINGVYVAKHRDILHQAAVPLQVEDATGAGDIFFAAYLARRLEGLPMAEAAQFGVELAARRLGDPARTLTLSPEHGLALE